MIAVSDVPSEHSSTWLPTNIKYLIFLHWEIFILSCGEQISRVRWYLLQTNKYLNGICCSHQLSLYVARLHDFRFTTYNKIFTLVKVFFKLLKKIKHRHLSRFNSTILIINFIELVLMRFPFPEVFPSIWQRIRISDFKFASWDSSLNCQARVQVQGLSQISNKRPGPGACSYNCNVSTHHPPMKLFWVE